MRTFRPNYLLAFTLFGFLISLFVLIPAFFYIVFSSDKLITFNSTAEASIFILIIFTVFLLFYVLINYLLTLTKSISISSNQINITSGVFGLKKERFDIPHIKSMKLIKILKTADVTETKHKAEEMQKMINKELQQGKYTWAYSGSVDLKRYLLINTNKENKLFYLTGWRDQDLENLRNAAEKVIGDKFDYMDYSPNQIKQSW